MFWWCSQDRSGPGVYIICCTKIWCLYGSQDRSGQVVTLSVVRRYDVSVFRGEIWARCLIVCCTTVYCLYDSQDRSGPGVYIIRWTKVWCLYFHRTDLGQVLFLVHGLVEVVVTVLMLVSACTISHGFTSLCSDITDTKLSAFQVER